MSDLAPILQGFFRVKLMQHKDASPHTISSYRDAWRLLLHYAQQATGTPPPNASSSCTVSCRRCDCARTRPMRAC